MSEPLDEKKQTFDDYAADRRKELRESVMTVLREAEEGQPTLGIVRILALIAGELLDANLANARLYEMSRASLPCNDPNCMKPQCIQMRILKEVDRHTKEGEEWRHDA